jgi:hypothetical protein
MQVETFDRDADVHPAEDAARQEDRLILTTSEFRELGLSQIGYVTAVTRAQGDADIVIYGADGLPVARVDTVEAAVDLVQQLGLAIVPVH